MKTFKTMAALVASCGITGSSALAETATSAPTSTTASAVPVHYAAVPVVYYSTPVSYGVPVGYYASPYTRTWSAPSGATFPLGAVAPTGGCYVGSNGRMVCPANGYAVPTYSVPATRVPVSYSKPVYVYPTSSVPAPAFHRAGTPFGATRPVMSVPAAKGSTNAPIPIAQTSGQGLESPFYP